MSQRRSIKTASTRPRAADAPARAEGTIVLVNSRFAVRLPLDEREPVPPPGGQDSPAWQLFYDFLGFLSAIVGEIPEMAGPGIVAFEVEAAYPGAPPGAIPEFEEGPIIARLRERLPAILRQESSELQTIIDQGQRIKVAAKFLRETDNNDIDYLVLTFVNHGGDAFSPSQAIDVTETPAGSQPETIPPQTTADSDPRRQFLDALLATVSKEASYEQQAEQREALKHAFNHQFAASHGEALKAEMLRRGANATTYDEKLELARWVNGELRRFGLAISSAKTGVGTLSVDRCVAQGRFQFKGKVKDEHGKHPYIHTTSAPELIESIAFIESPQRKEGWAGRIEAQADDLSHTGGQEAISDTGPPVTEGSIKAIPQTSPEAAKPVYEEMAKEFFSAIPSDLTHQFAVVTDRIDIFRQHAIQQLEVAANAFLASQKPQTFEDKKNIVEVINSRFDKIGVTIRYKDQACNLIAALSGGSPSGRFHLVPKGSNVPLLARVNLADILPIKLIDTPRRFPSRER